MGVTFLHLTFLHLTFLHLTFLPHVSSPYGFHVSFFFARLSRTSSAANQACSRTTMNLNQITIPSHNVPRAVDFYTKLGLRLIVDSSPRYVRFECPNGDSTFSIHHVEHPIPSDGVVIYFECENLDHDVSKLSEMGIKFDCAPKDQRWNWREAHLLDLDGNRLILFHAGENRKHPPWRINKR